MFGFASCGCTDSDTYLGCRRMCTAHTLSCRQTQLQGRGKGSVRSRRESTVQQIRHALCVFRRNCWLESSAVVLLLAGLMKVLLPLAAMSALSSAAAATTNAL